MHELLRLLVELEQEYDKKGWDEPAAVLTLDIYPEGIRAQQTPLEVTDPAEEFVEDFAELFTSRPDMARALAELQPLLYGLVIKFEAWIGPPGSHASDLKPYQSCADLPGARETRALVAVTYAGEAVQLVHYRGEKTQHHYVTWDVQGGPFFRYLASVLLSVAEFAEAVPEESKARLRHIRDTLAAEQAAQA